MRATLLVAPQRMELGTVPDPEPAPHQLLVQVQAVGLCGTDFHIFSGEANYNTDADGNPIPLEREPQILGHEVTGVVIEAGSEVRDMEAGDRVAIDQGLNCKSFGYDPLCEYCATGDTHQCEHYREHGITGLPGGLADALTIAAINTVRIESDLEPAIAAMTEPVGCVLHACEMLARAQARYQLCGDDHRRARSILVCGAGPAGALFVQVLRRVSGFEGQLIVSDPDPAKRARAESFGAESIDPSSGDVRAILREQTAGRLADIVIDATGSGPLFRDLPGLMRKQATLMLYGHGHGGVGMELLNAVQFREPTLLSPVGASGVLDPDGRSSVYRRALRLLDSGQIEVEAIVSHRFEALEAVPGALAGAAGLAGYSKGISVFS